MESVYERLTELGIPYEKYEHAPVHTVKEAENELELDGVGHTKNLFLRNKKGNRHYLISAHVDSSIDLVSLAHTLGEDRFSFASERRLHEHLGVAPGSVSLFALINDTEGTVHVVIDEVLFSYTTVGFHPNDNRATIVITIDNLRRFLDACPHDVRTISFV